MTEQSFGVDSDSIAPILVNSVEYYSILFRALYNININHISFCFAIPVPYGRIVV